MNKLAHREFAIFSTDLRFAICDFFKLPNEAQVGENFTRIYDFKKRGDFRAKKFRAKII